MALSDLTAGLAAWNAWRASGAMPPALSGLESMVDCLQQCPACFRLLEPPLRSCPRCGTALSASGPGNYFEPVHFTAEARFAASANRMPDVWELGSIIRRRYQLLGLLGIGGMGTVYRAQDLVEGRQIALKVLDADLVAHRTASARMVQEANALGRVWHANVVQLYDAFDCEGRFVLALELVAGGTLTEHIGRAGCPADKALYLLEGILSGLQAIHDAGLVHRDIKPDNVLLTAAGVPKLADLGIARDTMKVQGLVKTQIGARVGTPHYMSPEQAKGIDIDARSDIFSVGVLAYEMLTGTKAFDAPNELELLSAIAFQEIRMDRLASKCSASVADVLAQATAKDCNLRFSSPRAMARALNLGLREAL